MPAPGQSHRALGERDLPALGALIGRCLAADGGLPDAAGETFIRRQFLSGAGIGWFAGDGALIAAAALGGQRDGRVTAVGAVDPAFRGQGLGRRLLDWTIRAAADQPLLVTAETVAEPAMRLYARYGLRENFAELVMRAELGDAARPAPGAAVPASGGLVPGFGLRPWSSQLGPAFFAAYTASFRDRPGFPGWSQREWLAWTTEDEDFAPELSVLALDSASEPAGFVTVGANWIVQIGVVPRWRGHGLGRALLGAATSGIAAAGFGSCWLTVATNNPAAAGLYQQAGFIVAGRRARYELG